MLRAAVLTFCLVCTTAAAAAERVALVIGNAAYKQAVKLNNPANDANAVAKSLERLGFKVVLGVDQTLDQMRQSMYEFAQIADGAELALFYYAGHGIQVDGKNYLLPTDAKLSREIDLDFATVEIDLIMKQLDRAAKTRLVILDACRNNPFAAELSRSMGVSRAAGLGRGLAEIKASGGTMIAFATDPGAVAYDGEGDHSPFADALLKHMETPGLELNSLMQRVRTDVYRKTGEKQRPWTTTSLIGEVFLARTVKKEPATKPKDETPKEPKVAEKVPEVTAPQVTRSDSTLEIAVWQAAEAGGTMAEYKAYLDKFPEGAFSGLARARMDKLAAAERSTTITAANTNDNSANTTATPPKTPPEIPGGSQITERALGLNKSARREVQQRLKLAGHNPRGVDGVFGKGTRAAISDWQDKAGYPVTGYLNDEQLEGLKLQTAEVYATWQSGLAKRKRDAAKRKAAAKKNRKVYRARSYCSITGATGYGGASRRSTAVSRAVNSCIRKGGVPNCCSSNTQYLN